jgi:hypothetical protein
LLHELVQQEHFAVDVADCEDELIHSFFHRRVLGPP